MLLKFASIRPQLSGCYATPEILQASGAQGPGVADVCAGHAVGCAPHPGSDRAHPPLQSGLRLLQRIRQDFRVRCRLQLCSRRIDRLADLGTTIITLSGGEPTLHPDLDAIIARIRERGAIATLITNGLLLTPERIGKLNRAGLDYLQISIDNARPDEISKKSLQVLDRKLEWLAEHAEFGVTINSVLGAGIRNPQDALAVSGRARSLGFTSTVGILHDHSGQLKPLGGAQQSGLRAISRAQRLAVFVRAFRQFSGEHQPGFAECLALPRGRTVPVHLRRRAGALLLAAARASPGFRWKTTRWRICGGRPRVPKAARHFAPYRACIKPRCWTIFARSRARRWPGLWTGGARPIRVPAAGGGAAIVVDVSGQTPARLLRKADVKRVANPRRASVYRFRQSTDRPCSGAEPDLTGWQPMPGQMGPLARRFRECRGPGSAG